MTKLLLRHLFMGACRELQITKGFVGIAQGLEGAGAGSYPVEANQASQILAFAEGK